MTVAKRVELNQVANILKSLNTKQQKNLLANLSVNSFVPTLNAPKGCPHCGSVAIVKRGTNKNGIPFYFCKDCFKHFISTYNTILYRTHFALNVWLQYFHCMMSQMPIHKCAKICGICSSTAFAWRHKILDALQNMMKSVLLQGNVQADETYFHLSFKGAKKLPEGRVPLSKIRGKKKRGLSREQVCVVCGVSKDYQSVSKIASLGKPTWNKIKTVLDGHIKDGSTFVTDSFTAYRQAVQQWDVHHIAIPRGSYKKDGFNIGLINNYHARLKNFINRVFKGVATKYLNNYLVYFNFLHFAEGTEEEKEEILANFVLNAFCETTYESVSNRIAVPLVEYAY